MLHINLNCRISNTSNISSCFPLAPMPQIVKSNTNLELCCVFNPTDTIDIITKCKLHVFTQCAKGWVSHVHARLEVFGIPPLRIRNIRLDHAFRSHILSALPLGHRSEHRASTHVQPNVGREQHQTHEEQPVLMISLCLGRSSPHSAHGLIRQKQEKQSVLHCRMSSVKNLTVMPALPARSTTSRRLHGEMWMVGTKRHGLFFCCARIVKNLRKNRSLPVHIEN